MAFSTSERIPLTGADCFLRAFDYEARRYHGASHLAQLVLRLGPGFDLVAFESRLARIVEDHPVLCAAVRRPYLVGTPAYIVPARGARSVPVQVEQQASATKDVPNRFFQSLNRRFAIEDHELLRFDIVRYDEDGGTDIAMTWAHMLFDATGSERFVALLAGDGERRHAATSTTGMAPAEPFSWRRFAHHAEVSRRWGQRMVALGTPPPRSLAGPLRQMPQRLRYSVTTLSPDETAIVVQRGMDHAGYMTPAMFYLAATMRAHAAVFAHRGLEPECYLVPLPVRVAGGDEHDVDVGTHVSLLWFQVRRDDARQLGALVAELKRQRLMQIRDHAIEETATALEFVRRLPLPVYARMLRRNLHGELASFVFAFTGEILPGVERFGGAEIRNAFHAPAVQPSPGSGLILNIRRGSLNIAHVYQEGVMSDAERALLHDRFLDDLLRT